MKQTPWGQIAPLSPFRLLFAVFLILSFLGPQGALAQSEDEITFNVPIGRVREGPSLDSPILFRLKNGAKVESPQSEGEWRRIALDDGRTGWAHQSLFSNGLAQAEPSEMTPPDDPKKEDDPAEAPPEKSEGWFEEWYKQHKDQLLMIADFNFSLILSDLRGSDSVRGRLFKRVLYFTQPFNPMILYSPVNMINYK